MQEAFIPVSVILHLIILCFKELEEARQARDPTGTATAQALSTAATAITCDLTGSVKTTPGHRATSYMYH